MTFNLLIDVRENPNIVGEHLRHLFFAQDRIGPSYTFGCYSTFELRENVVKLPDRPVPEWDCEDGANGFFKCDETCENKFSAAELEIIEGKIKMLYFWNGDGFLSFILPDGSYLYNDDCKKDYCWKILDSFQDYWHTSLSL